MTATTVEPAAPAPEPDRAKRPTRPLEALSGTVRGDRLTQATLALLGGLTLVHLWSAIAGPLRWLTEGRSGELGPFLMLLATVLCLGSGQDRLQPEERRFWRDIIAGFSAWLVVTAIYLVLPVANRSLTVDLFVEGCFAVFYIALILAVERHPHRAYRWRPTELERQLAWPAVIVLILGLFGYFVVIPIVSEAQGLQQIGSTFLLYITLDLYLAGRFLALSRTARPTRWRTAYGLLGTAMALAFLNDLLEWQVVAGRAPAWGPVLDYLYLLPFVLVALTRCRHFPYVDRRADPETVERPELYFTRPSGRTMTHAVGFALLHFACYRLGFFPVAFKPEHESLAFWMVLALAAIAITQHRLLERKAQELWRSREKFELSMRHSDQDLRLMIERYHADEQLRLSEEKFSKAFHVCPDGMAITSQAEGRFLEVNEGFEQQTGYSRDELIGKTALEIGLWANPDQRDEIFALLAKQGSIRSIEGTLRTRSGEVHRVQFSAEQLTIEGERYLLSVMRDLEPGSPPHLATQRQLAGEVHAAESTELSSNP
ncbi:MAG: PAS domain S-box protein [Acidobacteriota bacterium]